MVLVFGCSECFVCFFLLLVMLVVLVGSLRLNSRLIVCVCVGLDVFMLNW